MKKLLIFFVSLFFAISNVNAGSISNIDVKVDIDESGNANITEKWTINKNENNVIEKIFDEVQDVKITDIKVSDNNTEYSKSDSINEDTKEKFSFIENDDRKIIKFTTTDAKNVYTLSYKVSGIVTKFNDTQGINWYFLSKDEANRIDVINIHISGPQKYDETNTALYAIGNNMSANFEKGIINVFASKLKKNHQLKLMTNFTNIEFKSYRTVNASFNEIFEASKVKNSFIDSMLQFVKEEIVKIIIVISIIVILVIIIGKYVASLKFSEEYYGFEVFENEAITKLDDIEYYDASPCNGNLYKIAFLSEYYKILKNPSDLIGAYILKWIYEDNLKLNVESDKPHIKIINRDYHGSAIDSDLFNILISASNYSIIDGSKLTRYASSHYMRIINWFNNGRLEVINSEYSQGNIKKVKKMKKSKLVIQPDLYEDFKKILGVKKYLLNFNQVPRKTELTNEGYKYLLITAELLGIGEQVGKEILRKNPENEMAKTLLDLQKVKHLYKDVYRSAYTPYKQIVKNGKNKSSYEQEIDKILNKKDI